MSCAKTTTGLAILVWLSGAASAPAVAGNRSCSATITGSFADACRDFTAHSTKDISYVELHYADGRVVKRRNINRRDWAIDGGPGDEIDFTRVKSGTTIEEFACEPANSAPTALLEIQTPPIEQTFETCYDFFAGGLDCEQSSLRTAWTGKAQIPDVGGSDSGKLIWGCGAFTPASLCSMTMTFRGIGSLDPDGDLASWTIDFGDGSAASGTWSAAPPTGVTHEYLRSPRGDLSCLDPRSNHCVITLTVTDSAGQSDSEAMVIAFIDQSPD